MLSKAIIAAFLATSAVALEVKPGRGHEQDCVAMGQVAPATARPLDTLDTALSYRGARTDGVVR